MPERTEQAPQRAGDIVDSVHRRISSMIIEFTLRPGERLNEVTISRHLSVSRGPVREALNRLFAEGMLDYRPNKGFFVKEFNADEIFQLFEARQLVEVGVIRLVVEKASDEDLIGLRGFWDDVMSGYESDDADGLVVADGQFHERLARLSKNDVVADHLAWINKRIRFVRWARLKGQQRYDTFAAHYEIVDALLARDTDKAVDLMQSHIDHRSRDIELAMADGLLHMFRQNRALPG